jgi:hypothetical protein
MEIVLGVSMTPTTVRMALVEGDKADGVILEHDAFDITAIDGSATPSASDQVIAAILGTQEGAIENGHHLVSTGVTWSDHAEAAVLREALEARGIEDVMLVSELHAAAALAQTVGRAVGYDKTALMFVERDTATLAVVETADGSVVQVLSQSLHSADANPVLTEMVTSLEGEESLPQGMFVVGSRVDVTSVKSGLQDLVSVPVIAPEEPQLALARGAALASANAPRFDASTVGLAYSQDAGITALLGYEDAFLDAPDIGSHNDGAQEDRKPFAFVGSSLTAVFAVGMTALAITMAVNVQPTLDRATGAATVRPSAVAPHPLPSALPARPQPAPTTVPEPAPAAPPSAASVTARLKIPPAPPPARVVVRNAAPAPAAPPPPPRVAPPPVIPAPVIHWPAPWLPPILQPPPYYPPRQQRPPWYPVPWGPHGPGGHGGSRHGDHDEDDGD